jgi:acetyl-CoA C-acetyltransferase
MTAPSVTPSKASRSLPGAVVIAARRSAIGRVGGLHRTRRLEELSAPIVAATLADSGCEISHVEGLILGNVTGGGNAARMVALSAGLPETALALTIDSQCASGLDAILDAIRRIAMGECEVLIAGGAESLSTAPWRIARPKNPYHLPRFLGIDPQAGDLNGDNSSVDAAEALARQLAITRDAQDAYTVLSHAAANLARLRRDFVSEIVPIRSNPEEVRDQNNPATDLDDLEDLTPFQPLDGTLTPGNTSHLSDGAAFVVVVSGQTWIRLGEPKGLVLQRSLCRGARANAAARAGLDVLETLLQQGGSKALRDGSSLAAIEMSEANAVQAISMVRTLGLADGVLNGGGGAIVRGHPLGAASAVSMVRLFSRMVRVASHDGRAGAIAQTAIGGIGAAGLFEVVG